MNWKKFLLTRVLPIVLFFLMDPNITLGSYEANPSHFPKVRVTSYVTLHKAIETKPGQNVHPHPRTVFTPEPSHPLYRLCEQDSVLQKFIKINLPRTASILLAPHLGLRLLYLYI